MTDYNRFQTAIDTCHQCANALIPLSVLNDISNGSGRIELDESARQGLATIFHMLASKLLVDVVGELESINLEFEKNT